MCLEASSRGAKQMFSVPQDSKQSPCKKRKFITIINEFMLLDSYQSQLPAEGFAVIRDIISTGTYLTRRGHAKGLFCCKCTSGEQALNQLH